MRQGMVVAQRGYELGWPTWTREITTSAHHHRRYGVQQPHSPSDPCGREERPSLMDCFIYHDALPGDAPMCLHTPTPHLYHRGASVPLPLNSMPPQLTAVSTYRDILIYVCPSLLVGRVLRSQWHHANSPSQKKRYAINMLTWPKPNAWPRQSMPIATITWGT